MDGAVPKALLHAKHVHPGVGYRKPYLNVLAGALIVAVVVAYTGCLVVRGHRRCLGEKADIECIRHGHFDAQIDLTLDHRHETVHLSEHFLFSVRK